MQDIQAKAANTKLVIFDVDGVLTDGSLYLGDDGQEYKAFNAKDGHGMKMLQASGVAIAVITARSSEVVRIRMQSLGIKHVFQGAADKTVAYTQLKQQVNLDDRHIAYVGDDVVDLPVMRQTGFAIAVADAHQLVKQQAHWTTSHKGGRGAAREVCELLMETQGQLKTMLDRYLT